MPTSQHQQISKIMDLVINLDPRSVLDVGVGFGKYGVLCREYLELWDGRNEYRKFLRRIEGIEAFEKYLTPLHQFIYNQVYVGDALKVVDGLDSHYDLALMVDVLEHFEKKDGCLLIQKLLEKSEGLIISVPKDIGDQKAAFGNEYEIHQASWSRNDFKRLGKTMFFSQGESLIVYLTGQSTTNLKKRLIASKTKKIICRFPLIKSAIKKLFNR